jgi:hypothetical protein
MNVYVTTWTAEQKREGGEYTSDEQDIQLFNLTSGIDTIVRKKK